jgi:FkbM family methyltransferase
MEEHMLTEWGNLTHVRKNKVSGFGPWVWRGQDLGTFEMIATDWANTHVHKIQNIRRRRVAIQAGGNMGMYPRLLSELFEYVYTFEPEPLNFFCLASNCQRPNIVKFQGFLSDTVGFHGFSFPHEQSNAGEFGMAVDQGFVPSFVIDSFKFDNVDLIWLDIEGSECTALLGAKKTIRKHRPVLMIENGDVYAPVKDFMEKMNYRLVDKSAKDSIFIHNSGIKGSK